MDENESFLTERVRIPNERIAALDDVLGLPTLDIELPIDGPPVQLFGKVLVITGYDLPSYRYEGTFQGCHAVIRLNDDDGTLITVITESHRLQALLETACAGKLLVGVSGRKLANPPNPLGGTWVHDVYGIYGVNLYGEFTV